MGNKVHIVLMEELEICNDRYQLEFYQPLVDIQFRITREIAKKT